jgi:hypothetical protein
VEMAVMSEVRPHPYCNNPYPNRFQKLLAAPGSQAGFP